MLMNPHEARLAALRSQLATRAWTASSSHLR
jgi:hypothetical protein